MVIVCAAPFVILIVGLCWSFWKELREEFRTSAPVPAQHDAVDPLQAVAVAPANGAGVAAQATGDPVP
jgi:choline-glycine betaine transporter